MRRDDLEEALHDAFDHEHLALYAEELQRLGDPRGELIAIDLRADDHVDIDETGVLNVDVRARRRELIQQLLGPVAGVHPLVRCRYGFIDLMFAFRDELRVGSRAAFEAVLVGPLGRYVRDVTLHGDGLGLRDLMIALAQQPRPFLTRLALASPHDLHYVDLAKEVAAQAVKVMPRLRSLEATGRRAIPAVEFPTVRHVVSHCYDAVLPLCASNGGPPCFPAVEQVNYRLVWTVNSTQLEALLPTRQLPSLRELDVSRCAEPVGNGTGEDVFRLLRQAAISPQLERLRVPGLSFLEQAINLQAAINRMPQLRELGIAGGYPLRAEPLRHPTATVRPISS